MLNIELCIQLGSFPMVTNSLQDSRDMQRDGFAQCVVMLTVVVGSKASKRKAQTKPQLQPTWFEPWGTSITPYPFCRTNTSIQLQLHRLGRVQRVLSYRRLLSKNLRNIIALSGWLYATAPTQVSRYRAESRIAQLSCKAA